MTDTSWIGALGKARAGRTPTILVTITAVQGHAPRDAGTKMVVSARGSWGSIGGGNIEALAITHARELLAGANLAPELVTFPLSDKAPYNFGVQCCGGTVTVLFESVPVPAAVAIFGVGHVGLELALILARHDIDLHLIDTRAEMLALARLTTLADPVANLVTHHVPLLPEMVIAELPRQAHILIMTHDHAEDLALCDAALRRGGDGFIGLIGSSGKWARFQKRLSALGHDNVTIARITTPIGIPSLADKTPATIAVSIAADLLERLASDRADSRGRPTPGEAPKHATGTMR